MFHRKIGGIHWFTLGRWRFAFCRVNPKLPNINKGDYIGKDLFQTTQAAATEAQQAPRFRRAVSRAPQGNLRPRWTRCPCGKENIFVQPGLGL